MVHTVLNLLVIPVLICFLYCYIFKIKQYLLLRMALTVFIADMITNAYFYITRERSIICIGDLVNSKWFYVQLLILITLTCMFVNKLINNLKQKEKIHICFLPTYLMMLVTAIANIYFGWLLSTSGRMNFVTFLYNFENPVNTSISGFYEQLSNIIFFSTLMIVCITYIFWKGNLFKKIKLKNRKDLAFSKKLKVGSIPFLLLLYLCYLPYYSFHLEEAYDALFVDDDFSRAHYVYPENVELTWPDKKRNLVYLFVESYESSFFSKELGGLSKQNLLPNITELMSEGTFFSNNESTFGGYESMPSTDWTIGGMVTATSGMIQKLVGDYRTNPEYCLLPGVETLMDLLSTQGYNQKFIIGTNSGEYNIGPYFRTHDVEIQDWLTVREDGRLPENYEEWWGFEDSKLFTMAKEDINELSQQDQPFLYMMSTNDTHSPEGFVDPVCKTDFNLVSENSIACQDQMISEFITWLKTQPYYENTTVVIIGDHISHETLLTKSFPESDDKNRRVFNLILNADSPESNSPSQYNRQFWSADLFPTVLSALNVEIKGNRLGLGSNLFSNVPTLIERFGSDSVRESLSSNSSFYMELYKLDSNIAN